ncbi:capsid portal protein [Rhizobium phage RHph_I4]|nr:capsid portal protein [Rhizobium phage RHph_I4]
MADTDRRPTTKPSTRAVRLDDDQTEALRVVKGELNSKQVEDPFKKFYTDNMSDLAIAEPPFSFNALLRMTQENAMLRQCIEAVVTNVEGHGYRMAYIGPEKKGENGGEDSSAAKAELENLEAFFDAPNDGYSLVELRTRCRWDLESLGNAYVEVGRNAKGEVTSLWHIPAQLMRITNTDNDPVPVKAKLARKTGVVEQTVNKYFRRYVQIVGTKKVYFKEFGDPRKISPQNGQEDVSLMHEDTATEIIHLRLYNPASIYGLPRWINQMPSIRGSRQAELTNLEYFSDNAVPAMIIMVSGGRVDQASLDALEDHVQGVRGRKAQHRIVMIEARGDEHAAAENGTIAPPKLEIKSLQGDRQGDALFRDYEKDCHAKVRSAFRLPPIFVGQSEDYTYATAKTSFEVAESQVFGPERAIMDDVINRKILSTWDVKNWQFRSNPPRISDPEEVIKAIETFNMVGAMTPNTAVGLANELFDLDIPTIVEEWGNWPFDMVKSLGAAGRLKGMEGFVEEMDAQVDPATGQPKKPGAPDGGKKPKETEAKEKAQRTIRAALLDLRNALAHPEETDTQEVRRDDGSVIEVRKRARG